MERKGEWLDIRLPKQVGLGREQLDHYLQDKFGMPATYLARLYKRNDITRIGDRLRLRLFHVSALGFPAMWYPLELLYEDDFCLVVNKPAGLLVHPTNPNEAAVTLANAVAFHYESTGQQIAVRHIHRLDEWTSGPVLYAKNEYSQYKLDEAMRAKEIERIYMAIVQGIIENDKGTINAPIGRDRHNSGKRRVSPQGDSAVTHYETVERYPSSQASCLRLQLETGRTHQIRVHLSHIGHPIIGDELYGGRGSPLIQRQALHGQQLRFQHPFSGELVEVAADLPADMQELVDSLAYTKN